MATAGGPNIVTNGLVVELDASNIKSYTSGSLIWYDACSGVNNTTLVNGPTFSSANGGIVVCDGLNDYLTLNNVVANNDINAWAPDGSIGSTVMSLEIWINSTDTAGYFISKPWNGLGEYNIQLVHNGFRLSSGNPTAGYTLSFSNSVSDGNWHQIVVWATTTQIGCYLDGGISSNSTSHGLVGGVTTSGNSRLPLILMTLYAYGNGWAGVTGHAIQGSVAIFRKYNRVLSTLEVLQNYKATKSRFNL